MWLNNVLDPTSDPSGDSLAGRRCTAHMRGLLWKLYRQDEGVRSSMYRLEQHIDGGFLCMRDPVSGHVFMLMMWLGAVMREEAGTAWSAGT